LWKIATSATSHLFLCYEKNKCTDFKWTFNQCFLSKLWCRCVGNHQKENLAKFGYRLDRKVKKFKNHTICWQHARTYCLNMASFFFLKSSYYEDKNVPYFISEKPLNCCKGLFLLLSQCEISPKKETVSVILCITLLTDWFCLLPVLKD